MRDLTNQPESDYEYRVLVHGRAVLLDGLELVACFEDAHKADREPTVTECAEAVRKIARWEDDGHPIGAEVRDTALFKVVIMVSADLEKVGNVPGLPSVASPAMAVRPPTSDSPSPNLRSA